jgi:hypothetical protein
VSFLPQALGYLSSSHVPSGGRLRNPYSKRKGKFS